ncbi:hypothetical protein RUM44_011255 [Polyplax serrata]|uniref:Uncharacterized protein n=1 Tax=Polyplax serrata TaxID=468196 RepID=A0ABR1API3_POLSC
MAKKNVDTGVKNNNKQPREEEDEESGGGGQVQRSYGHETRTARTDNGAIKVAKAEADVHLCPEEVEDKKGAKTENPKKDISNSWSDLTFPQLTKRKLLMVG